MSPEPVTISRSELTRLINSLAALRSSEAEIDARVGRMESTLANMAGQVTKMAETVELLRERHVVAQEVAAATAHDAERRNEAPARIDRLEVRLDALDKAMLSAPTLDTRPRIWESEDGRSTIATIGKIAVVVAALAFAPQLALTMWDRAIGTQTVRIEAPAPVPVMPRD